MSTYGYERLGMLVRQQPRLQQNRPHDFANYQDAEAVISEAFRDYNHARLHSSLKYVPPNEFLASWAEMHK